MNTMSQWSPQVIEDVDLAFPANVSRLMPPMTDIPDEFKRRDNSWVKWQQRWFCQGLDKLPEPVPDVDRDRALRHLKAIQGSFEPKHEHKEAAVAYLASLWFAAP